MKKRLLSLALCLGLCCLLLCPAALADDGTSLPDTPPAVADSAESGGDTTAPEAEQGSDASALPDSAEATQSAPAESGSGARAEEQQSWTGGETLTGQTQSAQAAEAQSPASDELENAPPASFLPGPGQVIELDDTPSADAAADKPSVQPEAAHSEAESEQQAEKPTPSRAVLILVLAALVLTLVAFALVRRKKKG